MKQPINEIKRMQQLAGLIKESQQLNEDIHDDIDQDLMNGDLDQEGQIEYLRDVINYCQSKINEIEGNLDEPQLNENSFGPDSNFQWKSSPANPEDMVRDEEEGDIMTKAEFWRDNIVGIDPEETIPSYGTKQPDGTWSFSWNAGEFSGFVEGDDFML